jgi:hypothetical protein
MKVLNPGKVAQALGPTSESSESRWRLASWATSAGTSFMQGADVSSSICISSVSRSCTFVCFCAARRRPVIGVSAGYVRIGLATYTDYMHVD